MARIRILPTDLVNRIAAGEVIERPASVVKELVENALDAGAREVEIAVDDGGRTGIVVQDDGHGMGPDDLPLAFAPHATSKLASTDDLFRIATFGFRGEALASIASVADVKLSSREPSADGGYEIEMPAGRVKPCAARPGTRVEVRRLFHNVPVRRKFMRGADVELDHVREAVARFGIARPDAGFTLTVDGRPDLRMPAGQSRRQRLALIYGNDVVEALIDVKSDAGTQAFEAHVAPPRLSRLTMKGILFFLNGRFIRDRVLTRAALEAYRDLVPHGRYPVAFVFLDVAPDEVDVNVHPTKIEVRFKSVWKLHDQLLRAIRDVLVKADLAPRIAPERFATVSAPPTDDAMARVLLGEPAAPAAPAAPALLVTGRRYFQVHNKFIVEEAPDGIVLYDQHALHERWMLEELRAQYARGAIARQRLLVPALARVTTIQLTLLEKHRDLLDALGVDFEPIGPGEIAVRSVPAIMSEDDPVRLILDFIELAEENRSTSSLGFTTIEQALDFLACRSAVRFGDRLQPAEIERLLSTPPGHEHAHTCAHGRPTSIKLTIDDLETFFRRRG